MRAHKSTILRVLVGFLALGWAGSFGSRSASTGAATAGLTINKQPVYFVKRAFNPASPPADMPPLAPGEDAECSSAFAANASVEGVAQPRDGNHATVTITHVVMTLELKVTIWAPLSATTQIIDHEEGHREISGYYYQGADKLAEGIAATYVGQHLEVSGSSLAAASQEALHKIAGDIDEQYNRQLNPRPAQVLYDSITDHGRKKMLAKDAVAQAIKSTLSQQAKL
jgi:hypothetical protein